MWKGGKQKECWRLVYHILGRQIREGTQQVLGERGTLRSSTFVWAWSMALTPRGKMYSNTQWEVSTRPGHRELHAQRDTVSPEPKATESHISREIPVSPEPKTNKTHHLYSGVI